MKKISLIFILLSLLILSCDGSESYQGNWKALDQEGKKFEITFTPSNFSIKDSTGKINKFSYIQSAIKYENSASSYGITLGDGRSYEIHFPKNDESVGLIKDENGVQMFTISRNEFITYSEIYKLN